MLITEKYGNIERKYKHCI